MTIQLSHQFRTTDQIYLFRTKDSQTLTLKIYDLSQKCIFKAFAEINFPELQSLFKKPYTSTFLNLFRSQNPPLPSLSSAPILISDLFAELHKTFNLLKFQISPDHKQIPSFTCPITLGIFKDPVMDTCGHTFEKSAIETHLSSDKRCPINRASIITSLVPNRNLKEQIETWQSQDSIPMLSLFKKENSTLVKRNLETAEACLAEEEYQAAIDAYTIAFQYTKKWQDYQNFPRLYQAMEETSKYHLALLCLAQYQIEAQAYPEAIQTLETLYQEKNSTIDLSIRLLLIHLYASQDKLSQALELSLLTAQAYEPHQPLKAQLLYQYILYYNPQEWHAYLSLSKLLSSSSEKNYLLLQGACYAIEAQNPSIAKELCQLALEGPATSFLNHYPHIQLLNQDPHQLTEKLIALATTYESQQDPKQTAKVYKYLITLESNPTYYQRLFEAQSQSHKFHQALDWALKGIYFFMQKKDYVRAETLAQESLKLLALSSLLDPVPLYTKLVELYTVTSSSQLQEMLNHLAQAHQKEGKLSLAEKFYRQAFEQFFTYEQAMLLAQILEAQNNKPQETTQAYYEAASLSFLRNNLAQMSQPLYHLLQIDPSLKHLQAAQKIHLMTMKYLSELKQELSQAQSQINKQQQELIQAQNQISRLQKQLPQQPKLENPGSFKKSIHSNLVQN